MNVRMNEDGVEVQGGLNVVVTDESVAIEDGKLIVSKKGEGYLVQAEGFATIEANTDSASYNAPQYDQHYYSGGNNYLSITQSVARAMSRIDGMLDEKYLEEITDAEYDLVADVVKGIIEDTDTQGRHTVYKVAGGVLSGMHDGTYEGVPFAWLFKGVVEGHITPPEQFAPAVPQGGVAEALTAYPMYFGRGA